MTNIDYINAYKGNDKIISDYYKLSKNGQLIDVTDVINPLVIDNRQLMSPTDNQKDTPHCAAYSAATLIESIYWKRTGKLLQLDSHQVYALAKQLDGSIYSEGTYLEAALKAVLSLCKKDNKFSFLSNAKIGIFQNNKTNDTIEKTKQLIHRYDFLQAGFQIDQGWYCCGKLNYILKEYGNSCGGHAVNICGYDETGFYILNQWGQEFGSKGFCIMPYDLFLKQFMYGAYIYNYEN